MRVDPDFSVATSGACRASTPISPAAPGTTIISASPSNAAPSGVTSATSNLGWDSATAPLRSDGFGGPCLLDRVFDRANHVEGRLGEFVVLAVDDRAEARDRVLELHVLAGRARELLGHEVRLRQEPLDPARPGDDDLVLVRELVHAEDRDDVLEVGVALEDLLHERRDLVVLVRDDAGLERARIRFERIHG